MTSPCCLLFANRRRDGKLQKYAGQPIFGFSSYADERPAHLGQPDNFRLNRRVELRFVMAYRSRASSVSQALDMDSRCYSMFSLPTGFPRISSCYFEFGFNSTRGYTRYSQYRTESLRGTGKKGRKLSSALEKSTLCLLVRRQDRLGIQTGSDLMFISNKNYRRQKPIHGKIWMKPIHHVYVLNYNPDDAFFVRLSKTMEAFDLSRSNGQSFYA